MKRTLCLLALVLSGACANATAPTAAAAQVVSVGPLDVQGCTVVSDSGLLHCDHYSGTIRNTGDGCAWNVRGTTATFNARTQQRVDALPWTVSGRLRPGEEVSYGGVDLMLQGDGWTSTTTVQWESINCR